MLANGIRLLQAGEGSNKEVEDDGYDEQSSDTDEDGSKSFSYNV